MSTLWVFGDSFTANHQPTGRPDLNTPWHWCQQVARGLGHAHYRNLATQGSSNEFQWSLVYNFRTDIQSGDTVIFQTTMINREWLFEHSPEKGPYWNFLKEIADQHGSAAARATEQYSQHLHWPARDHFRFEAQLLSLRQMAHERAWQLIVIPGFEDSLEHDSFRGVVQGCLHTIERDEFANSFARISVYDREWKRIDRRAAHLVRPNHDLVAERVLAYARDPRQGLDLATGFHQKVINVGTRLDPEWLNQIEWKPGRNDFEQVSW